MKIPDNQPDSFSFYDRPVNGIDMNEKINELLLSLHSLALTDEELAFMGSASRNTINRQRGDDNGH